MRGFTLIELIVTLLVMAALLGLVGLGLESLKPPPGSAVLHALDTARQEAAVRGEPVTVTFGAARVRFAPDGSAWGGPIITDSAVYLIEPLTAEVRFAAR